MRRLLLTTIAGTAALAMAATGTVGAQGRRGGGAAPAAGFDARSVDPASGPVVVGAPFSADATTTVTQTLGDGTHIEDRTTTKLYRDSTGRMRREQMIMGLDRLNQSAGAQTVISFDSVPGDPTPYLLDPIAKVASRAPRGVSWVSVNTGVALRTARSGAAAGFGLGDAARELERAVTILAQPRGVPAPAAIPPGIQATAEDLGTRQMEGVRVTGRRTTTIIPTDRIGNDRPIQITDERWESPDLHLIVYSRFSDPRTGVVEYKMTSINRSEPRADLFTVPSDYTVQEPAGQRTGGGGRGGRGFQP